MAESDRTLLHDIPDSLYRKVAWRILPVVGMGYFIAIIDRTNIGLAKLEMSADIGLSAGAYGLGAGIFFIFYCLFEPFSNLIMEKVGARVWITRILATWGVVTVATGFVQNTGQFYVARILLGIAEAGFYPGMVFYLALWFPRLRLTRALSLMVIASPLASMSAGPVSGWMIETFHQAGSLQGWQWMFIIQGIPAVLLAAVFFLTMSNAPQDAPWLVSSEKEALRKAVTVSREDRAGQSLGLRLKDAICKPHVWLLGVLLGTNYLGVYAVIFWLPTIIADEGIKDVGTVGWLSAIPWGCAVVATVIAGRVGDRSQNHSRLAFASMTLASLGLAASVLLDGGLVMTLVSLSCAAAFLLASAPMIWTIANVRLADAAGAAAGIALINSIASIGSFLGPYLLGLGRDLAGSDTVPMVAIAVVGLAGGFLALRVGHDNKALDSRAVTS
ncbi:MFS transporter [Aeromicrobium endophyticum]|nr:MFS transporter [Aeromicrobium endophyticum]